MILLPPVPALVMPARPTVEYLGRFTLGMLTFPVCHWGGGTGPTRTFTDTGTSGSSTTYTFSGKALGTAAGTSLSVVVVEAGSNGTGLTAFTAISIAGVAATIHAQGHGGSGGALQDGVCAIASATVAGTSGNVVATGNAASLGAACAVYRINNLTSTTPTATCTATTGTSGATSITTTLAVLGNSLAIWGGGGRGATFVPNGGLATDVTSLAGGASVLGTSSNDGLGAQTLTLGGTSSGVAGGGAGATWH